MRLAGVRVAHRPRQNVGEPPIYYVCVFSLHFVLVVGLFGIIINVWPPMLCTTTLSMVATCCERTETESFLHLSSSRRAVLSLGFLGVVAVQGVGELGFLGRVLVLWVSLSASMWFGLVERLGPACLLVVLGDKIHFLVVVMMEFWLWLQLLCSHRDGGRIVVRVNAKLLAKLAPLLTNLQGGNLDMVLKYEVGVEVCGLCRSSPSLKLLKRAKDVERKDGKEVQMKHAIQVFMVALEATTQKMFILKEDPQLKLLGRVRSSIDVSQKQVTESCRYLGSQEALIYLVPWESFIHSHTLLRKFKFVTWLSSHLSPSQVFWIFVALFVVMFKWDKKYMQITEIAHQAKKSENKRANQLPSSVNMEIWFVIIVTACIAALLKALVSVIQSNSKLKIPPGPRGFPLISRIQWLGKSSTDMEAALRRLCSKFGPIVSLPIGRFPVIFISNRSLAHQALVHNGAVFADRPKPLPTGKIMSSNQHNISSASYGPNWRLFRRNLTAQILHPSKAKDFSHARKWTLDILLNRLRVSSGADHADAIKVVDHFRFAMFCLLVFMCFGDKLDESQIKEIEDIQFKLLTSFNYFAILNLWPSVTGILLRKRWNELFSLKKKQEEVLIPKIRSRKHLLEEARIPDDQKNSRLVNCYVDSLLAMEIPEGDSKRKLTEEQLISFCSEFLNAGTDTTSTALQWIMANLVKYPKIQAKLFEEIKVVVGDEAEEVGEEDLSKMPYLKAIILEGLRRHPPVHFILPHTVTHDTELAGYTVPKNAVISFMVADINLDPEVWEDPMQFKPERFLSSEGSCEEFDITGSREIKMMSFGAGRRICPGLGLAVLHLEYYVANLVWNFEWKTVDGEEVDLSEKQEITTVMKHPLNVQISPRHK